MTSMFSRMHGAKSTYHNSLLVSYPLQVAIDGAFVPVLL